MTATHSGFTLEEIPGGLENDEVKAKKKWVPETPDHLPQLHVLCGAFGVVRSGKSNALVNLIQEYIKTKSLNCVYCISPTFDSNASLQTLKFEKVYKDPRSANSNLELILADVKRKVDEYEEEVLYKKAYRKWLDRKEEWEDINLLLKNHHRKPDNSIEKPKAGIFIDDMTHTELMANTPNNILSHLALQHRHLHGVGISLFQAFQTFKQGMPKVVRGNLGLILLFPSCNFTELKDIHEEVANHVTFDTFKEVFFEATKKKHGFLLINKLEPDTNKQFRINFDTYINVDTLAERRKLLFGNAETNKRRREESPPESSSPGVPEPSPERPGSPRRRRSKKAKRSG